MSTNSIAQIALALLCAAGCGANGAPHAAGDADSFATDVSQRSATAAVALLAQDAPPGENAQIVQKRNAAAAAKLQRQIIYDAQVWIVVEDLDGVAEKVDRLVAESGGFVASAQVRGRSGQPRSGEWKVRLPVGEYAAFLDAARRLGEVQNLAATSQDMSDQYYDLEARIRNKQKEEARLLKHLEENTGMLDDILSVERELSRVREELERMEGRMRVMRDLVSLTTVTLHINEIRGYAPPQAPTFGLRVSRAFDRSWLALIAASQTLVVAGVVIGPWFGAIGIPTLGIVAAFRRRNAATRQSPAHRG
jgi:hypothetical protein